MNSAMSCDNPCFDACYEMETALKAKPSNTDREQLMSPSSKQSEGSPDSSTVWCSPDDTTDDNQGAPAAAAAAEEEDSLKQPALPRGPLSPFSPLLRRQRQQQQEKSSSDLLTDRLLLNTKGENNDIDKKDSDSSSADPFLLQESLSLSACRKVSVVVRVQSHDSNSNSSKLSVFPVLSEAQQQQQHAHDNKDNKNAVRSSQTTTTTTTRALVVVNPQAMGKHLPSALTMDTARLVASLSKIPSEDWARTFYFQQVLWSTNDDSDNNNNSTTQSLLDVCRAMVSTLR